MRTRVKKATLKAGKQKHKEAKSCLQLRTTCSTSVGTSRKCTYVYKELKRQLWPQLNSYSVCLACTKPWVCSPALHGPGVVGHVCNPSTQEVQTGELQVQIYHWLQARGQLGIQQSLSQVKYNKIKDLRHTNKGKKSAVK